MPNPIFARQRWVALFFVLLLLVCPVPFLSCKGEGASERGQTESSEEPDHTHLHETKGGHFSVRFPQAPLLEDVERDGLRLQLAKHEGYKLILTMVYVNQPVTASLLYEKFSQPPEKLRRRRGLEVNEVSRQAVELNGARGFQTEVVLREDLKQRYLVLHSPTGSVLLVGTWMRDRDRQYVDQFLDSLRFNP